MGGGFIKYIVIMAVILGVAFLSQKLYSWENTKTFVSNAKDGVSAAVTNGYNWAKEAVFPTLNGEVQKRGELIQEGVEQQKEKISGNILEKTKNYFDGIYDAVVHPNLDGNNVDSPKACQPCQQQLTDAFKAQ